MSYPDILIILDPGYRRVVQADLDSGLELSTRSGVSGTGGGSERGMNSMETQTVYSEIQTIRGSGDQDDNMFDTTTSLVSGTSNIRVKRLLVKKDGKEIIRGGAGGVQSGEHVLLCNNHGGTEESAQKALFQVISGEEVPSSGDVLIAGYRPGRRAARLGYAPREINYLTMLTVREILDLFTDIRRPAISPQSIPSVPTVPLPDISEDLLDLPVHCLSAGTTRLLAMKLALASPTGVLLLDSPSLGMDAMTTARMKAHLLQATVGKTVILSSTYPEYWKPLCGLEWTLIDGVLRQKRVDNRSDIRYAHSGMYQIFIMLSEKSDRSSICPESSDESHGTDQLKPEEDIIVKEESKAQDMLLIDDHSSVVEVTLDEGEESSHTIITETTQEDRPQNTSLRTVGMLPIVDHIRGGSVVANSDTVIQAIKAELLEVTRNTSISSGWTANSEYVEGIMGTDIYSERLIRLTCVRSMLPISILWNAVENVCKQGLILDFSVKTVTHENDEVSALLRTTSDLK
eukprot:CAMPEP_0182439570 /NCGR_PEP_ID=MMETSP1167-20130531/86520_1 /TAXON_ID=2988 /ORGANISM="Mallomonas Sp, Strain CCMP3275" /LENGTH=515 /DNA_ID=CAMNT_0024633305 /DNA_START=424 /DNA_END=1972 /DNA_ORIENTATION=+